MPNRSFRLPTLALSGSSLTVHPLRRRELYADKNLCMPNFRLSSANIRRLDNIYKFCNFLFLLSLEILGSKETPYSGGSFKLEIQLPERLVLTLDDYVLLLTLIAFFFSNLRPKRNINV